MITFLASRAIAYSSRVVCCCCNFGAASCRSNLKTPGSRLPDEPSPYRCIDIYTILTSIAVPGCQTIQRLLEISSSFIWSNDGTQAALRLRDRVTAIKRVIKEPGMSPLSNEEKRSCFCKKAQS
ncbi:unnamed protein product [Kuraishia capsulata CBS 1993]|uniref:Uncharacterized protein n=1 Tax=Kuraishia capsulata CBS 1993 TaxID=1382522 RepID=W6MRJ7_9ASCO|nr:uncharacterized protein KUCA_T00004969001 [Kuraishia capsulata CBS 1993]CDK28983.1 unnamed protein product [Kuraishia capsulata CBS 1993]